MNLVINKNLSYKIIFAFILISFFIFFNGGGRAFASPSFEKLEVKESISVVLDDITIKRGYTFKTSDKNLILTLSPDFTEKKTDGIQVIINDLGKDLSILPSNKNFISNLYEIEIGAKNFLKNYILDLKYFTENESARAIYLYNPYLNKWSEVNTAQINQEKETFRLKLNFPYIKFAVLEEKPLIGKASWYKCKGGLYAASVDYPRKSFLKVTNLENNKTVVVKINDYGPDKKIHPDRIIDLDVVAFKKIANKKQGIIKVKVEKL